MISTNSARRMYFENPAYPSEIRAALIQQAISLFDEDPGASFNSVAKTIKVDQHTLKSWLKKHDPDLARKYEERQLVVIPSDILLPIFEQIVSQEIKAEDAAKTLGISLASLYRVFQDHNLSVTKTRTERGVRRPPRRRYNADFYRKLIDEMAAPDSPGVGQLLKRHGISTSAFKLNLKQLGLLEEYTQKLYGLQKRAQVRKQTLSKKKQQEQRLDKLLAFLQNKKDSIDIEQYMALVGVARYTAVNDLTSFVENNFIKVNRNQKNTYHLPNYISDLTVEELLEIQFDYNSSPLTFKVRNYRLKENVQKYFLDGASPLTVSQYARLLDRDYHHTAEKLLKAAIDGRAKKIIAEKIIYYHAANYPYDSMSQVRKANFMNYLNEGGDPATIQQYRNINAKYVGGHLAAQELREMLEAGLVAKYPGRQGHATYGLPGRDYQKEEYLNVPARRIESLQKDEQLISYLRATQEPITAEDYARMFNIPKSSAYTSLRQLVKAGILASFGTIPTFFHLPHVVSETKQKLRYRDEVFNSGSEVQGKPNNYDECFFPDCEESNSTDNASRGLCDYHYRVAKNKIQKGLTTEDNLLRRGLIREAGIRKERGPLLRRYSKAHYNKAIELCRDTEWSYPRISKKVGVPAMTLRRWCLDAGVRKKLPWPGTKESEEPKRCRCRRRI